MRNCDIKAISVVTAEWVCCSLMSVHLELSHHVILLHIQSNLLKCRPSFHVNAALSISNFNIYHLRATFLLQHQCFEGLGATCPACLSPSLPPLWSVSNPARTAGGTTAVKQCSQPQLLHSLGLTNTALPHARCHFSPWLASFYITIFSWCLPTDDEALIAMPVPDES